MEVGINVMKNDSSEKQENEATDINKTTVDNISKIGGMISSGRLFTPPELRNGKNPEKVGEEATIKKAKEILKGKALQVDQEPDGKDNKENSDEAAGKFL